jgi:hypothetical protein
MYSNMETVIKSKTEIIITEKNITKLKISDLELERQQIKEQLDMKEPSIEELAELGKIFHPYYTDRPRLLDRISKIDSLLK